MKYPTSTQNKKKIIPKNRSNLPDIHYGGKILMKGWIKYFKISLTTAIQIKENKNKNFVINFQYGEQFKLHDNMEMDEREKEGNYRYIRNKYNFWGILLNDSLNILSSREVFIFFLFIYLIKRKKSKKLLIKFL